MSTIVAVIRSLWHRLWDTPPPPPQIGPKSGRAYSARQQLHRIEWKLDRLGWHLTRLHLSLPISGPTEPISHSSTATSTLSRSQPGRRQSRGLKSFLKWLPNLAGWIAEKLFQFAWPAIGGLLLSLWVLLKHYGDVIWQYVLGCWHWLLG